jgi:hypothetical protein
LHEKERSIVASFLWVWWDNRNKANAKERTLSLEISHRAMDAALSFINQIRETPAENKSREGTKKWRPPPIDVLKINSDGAYREVQGDGARGFVIRGNDDNGVLAGSGRLVAVHDALAAEGGPALLYSKRPCLLGSHRGLSRLIR